MNDLKIILNEINHPNYLNALDSQSIAGTPLTPMRNHLLGCINSFICNNLDQDNLGKMQQNMSLLEKIIPQLENTEQVFYAKLYRLCSLVVERSERSLLS